MTHESVSNPVDGGCGRAASTRFTALVPSESAKFQLCCPSRLGADVQGGDPRAILGDLIVSVDERAKPFRERLELELSIDDDMILRVQVYSANVKDIASADFHDLEFGISMPTSVEPRPESGDPDPLDNGPTSGHQFGDLVVRSNVTSEANDSLVPGELLHTYKPGYFDRRLLPPQEQVEEFLYYRPCAICKRPSARALARGFHRSPLGGRVVELKSAPEQRRCDLSNPKLRDLGQPNAALTSGFAGSRVGGTGYLAEPTAPRTRRLAT
jgi:hypothetical protein